MFGKLIFLTAFAVATSEFPSTCHDGEHLLLPHETDCSKFYYCVFGGKSDVASSCAPGTVFSFEKQECDYPDNVNCVFNTILPSERDHHEFLPNGCPSNIHIHYLLPHEFDCTKFYYCNFGEKVERDCAPGTAFNFDIQVCDHPENVDCKTLDPVPTEPLIELNDQGCPVDFNIHYLVSHESECSKFYTCSNGYRFESSCGSGLWFNVDAQTCDWPENVQCKVDSESHENKNESESDENKNESHENKNESDENKNESDENKNESHENKNESHEDKNEPDESKNESDENKNESDENKNESHENKNESNENKNESHENTPGHESWENGPEVESHENNVELLENGCPADWSIHKLLPHEWDCTKFYYCVYGKLVERSCAPGTAFNYEIQVCDWPQNVRCANKPVDGQQESTEDQEQKESKEDETEDNPKETDEEDRTSSEQGSNDDGWLDNGCPAVFDIHYLVPDERDCSKFYYCVDGHLVPERCASGLVFNPVYQVCDWPDNYKCVKQESQLDNENEKSEEVSVSNEDKNENQEHYENKEDESHENKNESDENKNESHENINESHENKNESDENKNESHQNQLESDENKNESHENKNESQENKPNSVEVDNSCPLDWDPNVLIPDAEDCSKFYYCVYGQLSERVCPDGTLFDSQSQICDWADNVSCFNARCSTCNVAPWSHHTCGKYWRCDGEKVVLVNCSEGLHFNGETCDFAEKAGCQ